MSLNRYEQRLYDYVESIPEEKRFWMERVKEIAADAMRDEEAALRLNAALWDYFEERSRHDRDLSDAMGDGVKLSLLNLSEYLLRVWVAPKPKKRRQA